VAAQQPLGHAYGTQYVTQQQSKREASCVAWKGGQAARSEQTACAMGVIGCTCRARGRAGCRGLSKAIE